MKPILVALLMLLTIAVLPKAKVQAQSSETTCVAQCTDRLADCRDIAVTNLDNCLTNATSAADKARCKVAFRSERGACRIADETCLNTCSD